MKTKILLIAIFAILFSANNSSWAQSGYAGSKTVTSAGNVDLSEWIVPFGQSSQKYLLKIVAELVDPQLVMTGVSSWPGCDRGFPDNYADLLTWVNAQWAPNSLPGFYSIMGGNGSVLYDASYISWPWVGVDQAATEASPQLTSFNGTITAQGIVNLKLSSIFADKNRLYKDENEIARNQVDYQITETGSYKIRVTDGAGGLDETIFQVNISGTTPTVTSVVVSPVSASVEKGQTKQFTAEVIGTNSPAQTVTWSVEGATASSISTAGLLSVGSGETATTLVVRATSTVDNTKSGTASVTVTTPQPVVYTITATNGANSTLTPNGGVSVNAGENKTFTASYNTGYERNQLLIDGSVPINANTYTFTNVQANHTISLTAKVTTYSITYHLSGGNGANTGTYTIESGNLALPIPTKEGNTFQGWYGNVGLTGTPITVIPAGSTGNKEYWAKWEVIPATTYTITAIDDEHSTLTPNGAIVVNTGGSQTFTASYSTGYEKNQLLVDGSVSINANTYTFTNVQANHTISLTAKPTAYTITYHLNGGDGAIPGLYNIESETITLPIPTKEGNTFQGWYGNVGLTGTPITVIPAGSTGNKEYWAKWETIPVATYTITATDDEHSTLTPNGVIVVNAGGSQTFTASYSTGYEKNQLLVDGSVSINANTYTFTNVQANHTISLTAKATTYTITYHLSGGNGANTGTYTIESGNLALPIPTKEGNTFQGWYGNVGLTGTPITVIPAGSTGNKEYWAKWEAIPVATYTITATDDGSGHLTPSGVITKNAGENQTFVANYDLGYQREKLLVDGNVVNADSYTFTAISANHTIHLISALIPYGIVYHLNGGTGETFTTYVISNEDFVLSIPERSGYQFDGWYDNEALTGNAITLLPSGSIGNREFWAKWSIESGIEEIESVNFSLYPNPVQSILFLKSEFPIQRVAIYAISGNKSLEKVGDVREVEVSSLPAGVYIVRVLFGKGNVLSQKIVKY